MPYIQPEELIAFVFDKVTIQSVKPASLRVDEQQILKNSLFKKLVSNDLLIEVNFPEIISKNYKNRNQYIAAFNDGFHAKANRRYKQLLKEKKATAQSKFGDHIAYMELLPIMDVETGQRKLLNPKTDTISAVSYEVWEASLGRALRQEALAHKVNAKLTYDPYTLKTNYLEPFEDLGEVLVINTYVPPEWRKKEIDPLEEEFVECPPLAMRLLNHLFPDPECLRYVINWMYNALVIRNETYLVLNSAKGVGKGIFTALLKSLVGVEHYTEASRGFLESQFNSLLNNKRLVVLDEISVNTSDKVNKLKSYINKYQNIEGKYKSADNIVELFTSFVISNNSSSDMHIEADDRRFSVPDITELSLRRAMSSEEIRELVYLIEEDIEFQRDFGYWIYLKGRSDEYDQFSIWKGEKYKRLVYSSLPDWSKFLLELLQESTPGTHYTHRELKKLYVKESGSYNVVMAGKTKIEDLLKNFKVDGQIVGEIGKNEEGHWSVICTYEKPEKEQDEDIDDLLLP